MKTKRIITLFLISFITINLLMYLDYETVSLIEIYRNSESTMEVAFGTLILFIVLLVIYYIAYRSEKKYCMERRNEINQLIKICEKEIKEDIVDLGIFTGYPGLALYYFEKHKLFNDND
ncbi:MAG: hypothetical protein L0G30_06000, partial [Chryseobacterium sp.]|nr:hypothetical protein [Chryseobacterium sp.]